MQEVNIYIDIIHSGHLKTGTGTYGIVLEYIKGDGTPATMEVFEGLKQTTKNRTSLKACIVALEHLVKQCSVIIHINNTYVAETVNQGWYNEWDIDNWTNKEKPIKNADLWQQLLDQMNKHNVEYQYAEKNQYSAYMATMVKRLSIEYQEDKKHV